MPASATDYSKIKQYQDESASLVSQGKGLESGAFVLGDKVMEAVRADRLTRGVSKLATDTGNVMGQMVSDPNQIRTATSGMVDPFSVNALTSGARAQNLRTLGTVSTREGQNQGTIQEVIQAGANQLRAQAEKLYAQAQEKASAAESLQKEWERAFKEKEFAAEQANKAADRAGKGTTRDKDYADFSDDALGFKDQIAAGKITVDQAKYILQNTYPWVTPADLDVIFGVAQTPAPEVNAGASLAEAQKNIGATLQSGSSFRSATNPFLKPAAQVLMAPTVGGQAMWGQKLIDPAKKLLEWWKR